MNSFLSSYMFEVDKRFSLNSIKLLLNVVLVIRFKPDTFLCKSASAVEEKFLPNTGFVEYNPLFFQCCF